METFARTSAADPAPYVPPPGPHWSRLRPEEAGMRPEPLAAAAAFALAHESTAWPREMVDARGQYPHSGFTDRPEWDELIGPVKRPRGGPNGLVLRHGHIVAEWGDTARVDMTFSISKSYLALAAGLACERGLIRSLHDPVRDYGLDEGFEAPHNRPITWHHLLQQTSEWEGTLWGKPDLVDRNRAIGGDNAAKGQHRDLRAPGTFWEYNDVRVNRLALSLTLLFRRNLADVLREAVLDPIGCAPDWSWPAYRNATVTLDGAPVAVVPGGGHWGGGLWIASRDHARMALLVLRGGVWGGRRVLPAGWVEALATPAPDNPGYGYLWWLNPGGRNLPGAPERSLLCRGAGTHLIWIDPEHDLVLVSRWVDRPHWDELCGLVLESLGG